MPDTNLTDFLGSWSAQVKELIEPSASEPFVLSSIPVGSIMTDAFRAGAYVSPIYIESGAYPPYTIESTLISGQAYGGFVIKKAENSDNEYVIYTDSVFQQTTNPLQFKCILTNAKNISTDEFTLKLDALDW